MTIHSNKKIKEIKINFPQDFLIVDSDFLRKEKMECLTGKRYIKISNIPPDENVIFINLKVDGKEHHPIVDSSDLNFPLISAKLEIECSCHIEPEGQEYDIQVTIIFPEGCKGYVNHSTIEINNEQYKFGEKGSKRLIHGTSGISKDCSFVLYSYYYSL